MANAFYNRGASFNPDELADGDAIEEEFDSVGRGFDTIEDLVNANKAGYPTQTFYVAPATQPTHAVQKAQLDLKLDAVNYNAAVQKAQLDLKLDAVNYNASDILTKLKTVDGSSSGLDADLLDGQDGSYYRNASNINAGTLAKERLPASIDASTTGNASTANKINSLGDVTVASGRSVNGPGSGVFTYGYYNSGGPTNYGEVISFGSGAAGGQAELAISWGGTPLVHIRSLRDTTDSWTSWLKVLTDGGSGSITGNAATASKVAATAPLNGDTDLVVATMGGNDFFRIRVGGNTNTGWTEIATADDGNEPIHVRQYTGDFASVARTLTLLDAYGVTKVPVGVDCTNGYGVPASGTVGNGICGGNGDNCTSTINNLKVAAWWGIGFGPSVSGQEVPYGEYSHWFNTRNGDMGCRGTITANFFNGRAYPAKPNGEAINFYWAGQGGQPPWLWGGSDGVNMYVYNPSNFSVNYANSAGSANYANSAGSANYANTSGWVNTITNNVTVLTGTIGHSGWLPIPNGYQEGQCRFFISMNNTNPNDNSWDWREEVNTQHYSGYCRLINTRQVEAFTRVYNDVNDSFQYHNGVANYIVIGYK